MKKVIVFEEDEFKQFYKDIIEAIIKTGKKNYGAKFISRDTEE